MKPACSITAAMGKNGLNRIYICENYIFAKWKIIEIHYEHKQPLIIIKRTYSRFIIQADAYGDAVPDASWPLVFLWEINCNTCVTYWGRWTSERDRHLIPAWIPTSAIHVQERHVRAGIRVFVSRTLLSRWDGTYRRRKHAGHCCSWHHYWLWYLQVFQD